MRVRFTNAQALASHIYTYFSYIEGEFHLEEVPVKPSDKNSPNETKEQKIWDRPPEPPTLSGLAYHLGFDSRQAFETYETKGKYGDLLKRARLQIEAEYEKKLHFQSCTGATFALKNMGWNEHDAPEDVIRTLEIKITETGPSPVGSEQEVDI